MTTVTTTEDAAPPAAPAFEPAALADGEYACASCGIAVRRPRQPVFTVPFLQAAAHPAMPAPPARSLSLSRCVPCLARRETADSLNRDRITADRIEDALCALEVLGRPLPGKGTVTAVARLGGMAALLHHLQPAGRFARWQSVASPGYCAPAAWAHVTEEDRAELRKGLAGLLAERVAAARPPLRVEPPAGDGLRGCLLCGVGHVEVPAARVARLGGPRAAADEAWRRMTMQADHNVRKGHICPACAAAEDSAGASGLRARGRALLDYLTAAGRRDEADKLRQALTEDESVMSWLPPWCATGRERPSESPWEHLGQLKFESN